MPLSQSELLAAVAGLLRGILELTARLRREAARRPGDKTDLERRLDRLEVEARRLEDTLQRAGALPGRGGLAAAEDFLPRLRRDLERARDGDPSHLEQLRRDLQELRERLTAGAAAPPAASIPAPAAPPRTAKRNSALGKVRQGLDRFLPKIFRRPGPSQGGPRAPAPWREREPLDRERAVRDRPTLRDRDHDLWRRDDRDRRDWQKRYKELERQAREGEVRERQDRERERSAPPEPGRARRSETAAPADNVFDGEFWLPPGDEEAPEEAAFESAAPEEAEAASVSRPEAEAERYLNVGFTEADRTEEIPQTQALVNGRSYALKVWIGEEHAGLGEAEAPFPDRALAEIWQGAESLELTVVVASQDFEVAPGIGTIALPRRGAAGAIYFDVRPRIDAGNGYVQVDIFYRGFLLQSKQVRALVAAAERAPGDHPVQDARVTFTTTAQLDPQLLARLPERLLTIDVDRHPETGNVQFRFLDRSRGDQQIALYDTNLQPASLGEAIDGVRRMLRLMVTGDPARPDSPVARGYQWMLDGDAELLDVWLPRIANAGRGLYRALLPDQAGQEETDRENAALEAALVSDAVIQVNPVVGLVTVPWALLYRRPVMLLPGRTRACRLYGDFAPDCAGCPNAADRLTVCPNAFWGYRYVIEQLPCWTGGHMPATPSRLSLIKNGAKLTLNFNVWRDFLLWRDHLPKLQRAGRVRTLVAEEILPLVELWDRNQGDLDVVYFYSHGGLDQVLGQPYLEISDGRIDSNLLEASALDWPHNPLVFLNGCATGDYGPGSYLSLIEDFRRAGASAVVGTECPVPETFAEAFAAALFPRLFRGEPLGPAMLAVRRAFLRDNANPLGLLYTLYAASEVALAHPVGPGPRPAPTGEPMP